MSALRFSHFAALMLALAAVPWASAQECPEVNPEAVKWLDKMSRSLQHVSYHGVVTFQRGGEDMQVVQVSHSVDGGTSTDRLTQLTGQGAEVVRKDHPLDCIHPGHNLLRLGQNQCGVAANYRLSVSEGDLVAGRHSVRIAVAPRDMYRYGYVMELDRDTGLLLKTATIGRGNKVLEKFQFANLSYGDDSPEGLDTAISHSAHHPVPAASSTNAAAKSPGWRVRWLPPGFAATDAVSSASPRKTYTDGLAVFSVFLEKLDREIRPGEGVARKGSSTSYTRGVKLAGEPVLLTVVGEVPVNTARMVADSVVWER
ncbi:negative regulator for alginate biosynthesis [Halioglobus maricola]|uniref:Negative regulator for alginate biosynthesis n=1 Tax=Halioglobus maricola TaxID=2601894 RepID=A0A5P9NLL9_9GAMM|nr:MucB/RseB C-terminal domain-containing protein [Halioglobus maricola]QFU76519.1 negative regulator for alginate biosynthesis [Halioglobus maricola]